MENIVAAFAQFDNDVRSDRTIAGMEAAAKEGRWTHKAPIGYRFEGRRSSARLVPDNDRAAFVRRAFEMFATGIYKASEVLSALTREGFRTTRGTAVSAQTFNALLRNEIYTGWIVNRRRGTRHQAIFDALVDRDTFDAVQRALGESRTGSSRKRVNLDFPLKGTVLCGECGCALTASKSTGRNSTRYGYYSCWRMGCGKVSVRAEILESDFLRFLARLQPKPAYVRLLREIVLDRWKEAEANVSVELANLSKRMEKLEEKRVRLVDLLAERRITQEAYDATVEKLEDELRLARVTRRELQIDQIDVESLLDLAEVLLQNVASMWMAARPEQKQLLQRVVLPQGVRYSEGRLGNAELLSVFKYLREIQQEETSLVAHTGFEPVLPP
jgi:site-specific DNA recombinase